MSYPNKIVVSIEDDPVYAQFLEKICVNILKSQFKHFFSPPQAFDWFAEGINPDLILLDMELPKMDGVTAFKYIRTQLNMRDVKVIPCTSLASPNLLKILVKLNIADYIQKKTGSKAVIEKISNALK